MTSRRFIAHAKLPDQVFRNAEEFGFLLTDSALLSTRQLWPVLSVLMARFGEDEAVVEVVDLIGAASIPVQLIRVSEDGDSSHLSDWLRSAAPGSPSPRYVDARTLAISATSGVWGLWIDQDREVAVLGVPSDSLGEIRELLQDVDRPWLEAVEIRDLLAPAFHPNAVPEDWSRSIVALSPLRASHDALGSS